MHHNDEPNEVDDFNDQFGRASGRNSLLRPVLLQQKIHRNQTRSTKMKDVSFQSSSHNTSFIQTNPLNINLQPQLIDQMIEETCYIVNWSVDELLRLNNNLNYGID